MTIIVLWDIISVRVGVYLALHNQLNTYVSGERMVQFKDLANKAENRKVRELIFANGETVKVFEPSQEDIKKIFDLQEKFINEDNPERLSLTSNDVIYLFSLLTDIEGLEDLTDEDIQEVTDNPSMALLQAQNVIEGIVIEVYKMVILSVKNRILETDLNLEQAKTTQEVMERTLGLAQRDGKTKEYADKVEKAKAKVLEFRKSQEIKWDEDEEPADEKETPQNVKPIEKHANQLASFRQTFGETSEEDE